jgi:hypothetical protein
MVDGVIKGRQLGHEWHFAYADRAASDCDPLPALSTPLAIARQSSAEFEDVARSIMSRHFNIALTPGRVPGVPKTFDLVSQDWQIVGDAKYYTLVQNERLPPAKFSVIAEHVWLLEKTRAQTQFLVFGNDRRVPEKWLATFGNLARMCEFFFLAADNQLQRLKGAT